MPFAIRSALAGDALAILEAQRSAVRGGAASDAYRQEIIDHWAPERIAPQRIEAFARSIERREAVVLVAEDEAGRILGFGSIVPGNCELRALYVRAEHGRCGVGRAILSRLEALAREAGLEELRLDASVNAVPFYRAQGYIALERGEHVLKSGARMDCVRMRKAMR
jgi:ribosomal protein S18 acetylase RimI-like enzyme